MGCIFPVVVASMLSHAEFGRIDHREDAPDLSFLYTNLEYFSSLSASMCNEIDFFEHFKIGSKYSQESP